MCRRPDRGSEIAWLYGVARNTVLAQRRRTARELRATGRIAGRRLLDADDIARLEERVDAESPARLALEAMADLPDGDRALLELVAVDGLSPAEAATAVAVPLVAGQQTPAYALTKHPDGSISLQINEFRDPDQVERDLAKMGVRADVTYLPLGKRCADGRAPFVAGDDLPISKEEVTSKDPAVQARIRKEAQKLASARAIRSEHGITIRPRFIGPGQIVLIEINENPVPPDTAHPGVAWQFSGRLTDGPVTPCRVVDDPGAFDMGTAGPPPGS